MDKLFFISASVERETPRTVKSFKCLFTLNSEAEILTCEAAIPDLHIFCLNEAYL